MTWTVNITGHVDDHDQERVILNHFLEVLKDEPPGMLTARFNGMFVGSIDLRTEPDDE